MDDIDPNSVIPPSHKHRHLLNGFGGLLFRPPHNDMNFPKGSWVVMMAINHVIRSFVKGTDNQFDNPTSRTDIEAVIEDAVSIFTGQIAEAQMPPFYSKEQLAPRLITRFELDPRLLEEASFETIVRLALINLTNAIEENVRRDPSRSNFSEMEFAHNAFFDWPHNPDSSARISDFIDCGQEPPTGPE